MVHPPARWQPGDTVVAPLDFYRGEVLPAWVDYNRHMTEAAYLTAFGWASDALFTYIGDDDQYRTDGRRTRGECLQLTAQHQIPEAGAPVRTSDGRAAPIGGERGGANRRALRRQHRDLRWRSGVNAGET